MLKKKVLIIITALFLIIPIWLFAFAGEQAIETIYYGIEPVGSSVYQNFGDVEFQGKKLNLVIFKTNVLGFKDTEKIYSDIFTGLPLWVERDLSMWTGKEYLTEEYLPQENRAVISKFKNKKKVDEYRLKAEGPIHNAVIMPFSLRKIPVLKIGWSSIIRLPKQFEVRLVSIEEVVVPAGKFQAYHFTSIPNKFEIWISADKLRLPVKIKGAGGLPYVLVMKEYVTQQKKLQAQ